MTGKAKQTLYLFLKIEVDIKKKSVADAIKLLNPDNIIDINISNVPFEDIISNIYRKEK